MLNYINNNYNFHLIYSHNTSSHSVTPFCILFVIVTTFLGLHTYFKQSNLSHQIGKTDNINKSAFSYVIVIIHNPYNYSPKYQD